MGKRYKKGNVGRKRKIKQKQIYYRREKLINKLINQFKTHYFNSYSSLNTVKKYKEMYLLKSSIKFQFHLQESDLFQQSHNRRSVYYDQLNRFKLIYTMWKRSTRYAFLSYICHVPPYYLQKYIL